MTDSTGPDENFTSAIERLDDETAARILADLTRPRLRGATDEPQWTPQLARALCVDVGVTPAAVTGRT